MLYLSSTLNPNNDLLWYYRRSPIGLDQRKVSTRGVDMLAVSPLLAPNAIARPML